MQVVEGRVLISPSDITSAAACEFAWLRGLDLRLGRIEQLPNESDPLIARAADLGLLHDVRSNPILRDPDRSPLRRSDAFRSGRSVAGWQHCAADREAPIKRRRLLAPSL